MITTPAPAKADRSRSLLVAWLLSLPAPLVAILGILGLVLMTLRMPTTTSGNTVEPDLVRYSPGLPLAARLIVVFVPGLDDRGIVALRGALGLPLDAGTFLTIDRPDLTSFDSFTQLLLAGQRSATDLAPVASPMPDTLVSSTRATGRGVYLAGRPEWRALFGPDTKGTPEVHPKVDLLLADAGAALRARGASLVVLDLRDLTPRAVTGELAGSLADVGSAIDSEDAILLIGGGGIDGRLHLSFSGAGLQQQAISAAAFEDLAPTGAVVLGVPYPLETRGHIAWSLLNADEERKARATAALALQRTTLATRALPFNAPYPTALRSAVGRLGQIDATLRAGQFAFGYQLASSSLDEADRALIAAEGATPLPPPRHAAWALAIPCATVALLAILLALGLRAYRSLLAAVGGAAIALAVWLLLVTLIRRAVAPTIPLVAIVLILPALCGATVSVWLSRPRWPRRFLPPPRAVAVELLALLAVLPAAFCAYRYGLPWRLRPDEAVPLFRWRSALLAPTYCLLAGYGWLLRPALLTSRRASQEDHGPDV